MKKALLLAGFFLATGAVSGQDSSRLRELVMKGVQLHDQGQYEAAIKKYDEALALAPDFVIAQYEKSYSLMASKKFRDAIELSQRIIKNDRADSNMIGNAYSTWGTALDEEGDPKKAIKVYEEGIKKVPGFNMLDYNKAICYLRMNETDKGLAALKMSLLKNPQHASSHYTLGRVLFFKKNRIAALMPYMVYLLYDNGSPRATDVLATVRSVVEGSIKQTDSNSYRINIAADVLGKRHRKARHADDDFQSLELLTSLSPAASLSETKDMLPADRFALLLSRLIGNLALETGHNGFYGKFYLPFFKALSKQKYAEAFAHQIFLPSGNVMNQAWIQDHRSQMDAFLVWMDAYKWPGIRDIASE
ncbi:hypothetical protein A8C56_08265 [Niabella ginsenosidivorans]|uniref:Uncharacterized protein n=2 Tax=Niabella ginsenosidivorans TaxID=1176587 RepID=A0A1A9I026_9BACT|nr:hypothetical protein A8C56_08265 [Niabella ginsenosidivorans]